MTIPEPRCSQAIALALLSALGWLGGCSDNPGGLNSKLQPPPEDLVVSNPALIAGVTARAGSALARPAAVGGTGGSSQRRACAGRDAGYQRGEECDRAPSGRCRLRD